MGVATIDYIRNYYVDEFETSQIEYEPITVCTPMYNSTPFLKAYLTHVLCYDWPRDLTSLMFTVQGDDATYDVIRGFFAKYGDEYRRTKVKRVKQYRGGELPHVRNVVMCRNLLTGWSKPDKYVFFNDHDNFSPPVCIKRLMRGIQLGADGAAGVYLFYQRNEDEDAGHIGFTAFFMADYKMHHYSLNSSGRSGTVPTEMLGRRLWCDAVAMGSFLVKRELLDAVPFFVPYGTTMTDDTALCLKAREKGYRFMADFGLFVQHWGYNIRMTHKPPLTYIEVNAERPMTLRREKMKRDGIYVHPRHDVGLNEAARKYIDLDKIK